MSQMKETGKASMTVHVRFTVCRISVTGNSNYSSKVVIAPHKARRRNKIVLDSRIVPVVLKMMHRKEQVRRKRNVLAVGLRKIKIKAIIDKIAVVA